MQLTADQKVQLTLRGCLPGTVGVGRWLQVRKGIIQY
jgi:hypothetical protein